MQSTERKEILQSMLSCCAKWSDCFFSSSHVTCFYSVLTGGFHIMCRLVLCSGHCRYGDWHYHSHCPGLQICKQPIIRALIEDRFQLAPFLLTFEAFLVAFATVQSLNLGIAYVYASSPSIVKSASLLNVIMSWFSPGVHRSSTPCQLSLLKDLISYLFKFILILWCSSAVIYCLFVPCKKS